METRGFNTDTRSDGRPAIARRSCDQCRARKTGCDRGSPCSNCVSARLNCTHSVYAAKIAAPKQKRVLITAQYEQKIDDIARDIDGIKLLLRRRNASPQRTQLENGSLGSFNHADSLPSRMKGQSSSVGECSLRWDHSAHILDFVKAVVDKGSKDIGQKRGDLLSSLEKLVQTLEGPDAGIRNMFFQEAKVTNQPIKPPMPPLEAVVTVLRWIKDHEWYRRIDYISGILPLQRFADICQKVYFAVEDYSELDFIIANGYLSFMFSEHSVVSGLQLHREYGQVCQTNFHNSVSQLPLLSPASTDQIAALTLGALSAIENSLSVMAWTLISAASNHCQTLGYHRARFVKENSQAQVATQERLFWTVYALERSLSFRLGRSSHIRDTEITLPSKPKEASVIRLARIQGKVHDELYSPASLSRSLEDRIHTAEILAEVIQGLISEMHVEISATTTKGDLETDPMQIFYLQCDLVCHYSLLALVLRAIPPTLSSLDGVSDNCIAVARETLSLHQQCIDKARGYMNDPFVIARYINWAILHSPFVPFSILFTHAVQSLDVADLTCLGDFAASLRPEAGSPDSITHPYRLYSLLYQTVEFYFDLNASLMPINPDSLQNTADSTVEFDFVDYGTGAAATSNAALAAIDSQTYGLGDWYYGNQQMMSLFDEDMMFELPAINTDTH